MRQYAWAILVVAGVFETGFSIGLKYSEGFTRLWPSIATAIMIVLSLGLVLLLATPYHVTGGAMDFRLDFAALCLYGALMATVIRSEVFASRPWSLVAGGVAVPLVSATEGRPNRRENASSNAARFGPAVDTQLRLNA